MNEYESVQQDTGDAMASQPAGSPQTNEAQPGPSGPQIGVDPRVLARMPDLNGPEPEVTNKPSRRRHRTSDNIRPGSTASPKVVLFAVLAVVAVIAVIVMLNRPDGSDSEQASDGESWDAESPGTSNTEAPLWGETADTEGRYPATPDAYQSGVPYPPTDPYAPTGPYPPTDPYSTAGPYPPLDPSQNLSWGDQQQVNEWGQTQGEVGRAATLPTRTNQQDLAVDRSPPPARYNRPQVGAYDNQGGQTWGNQAVGTLSAEPNPAPAATNTHYGTQSTMDQAPYSDPYRTARPPAPYQDPPTYGATGQRSQVNPYVDPPIARYTRTPPPRAAVTIDPPPTTPSLRDQRRFYPPQQTNSGAYSDTSRDVPVVAERPVYRDEARRPSTNAAPYRDQSYRTGGSLPPSYQSPAAQQPGYGSSYRQDIPPTSYPGTNSAPRYSVPSTSRYSQPGQPGVASSLDGVNDSQPPARASYDSPRPSLY